MKDWAIRQSVNLGHIEIMCINFEFVLCRLTSIAQIAAFVFFNIYIVISISWVEILGVFKKSPKPSRYISAFMYLICICFAQYFGCQTATDMIFRRTV